MSTLYGLILAGGESIRMGQDKSLIDFHGKPQREYVRDLLSEFCDKVFLSCRSAVNIPQEFNPIVDKYDFKSPMNGILSAFDQHPDSAWLTVPVDMPNVDASIIRFLLKNRNPKKVATCFFDSDGKFPEPLFTIWEPAAYPLLKAFQKTGKVQPRNFLMTHDVEILVSPDPKMHTNINSPDDLQDFKA